MKKPKKTSTAWWVASAIVLVAIAAMVVFKFYPNLWYSITDPVLNALHVHSAQTINEQGMNEGGAPWPAETAHLKDRLTADGLPALSEEGTVLHIHQHLDIYLDGVPLQIPAGIGINEAAGFISPIHVHDVTGIIHVESPTVERFTLGQFFDVWGVAFTATRIGGYYNTGDKTLRVYVNGQPYEGDPRDIELTSHEEIAIVYGTESEIPKTIPSTFSFPEGY